MPTVAQLAAAIDHAVLHPALRRSELIEGCRVAAEHRVAALCVRSCDVPVAAQELSGSGVAVCSVIAFPHGAAPSALKLRETEWALDHGATEVDVVVNVGSVLDGDWDSVRGELAALQSRVAERAALLKVIFENVYLGDEHRRRLCQLAAELGIAYVKTSTGFGTETAEGGLLRTVGARESDVRLMLEAAGPQVKVKASGGIKTLEQATRFLEMGVARLGTSATVALLAAAGLRPGATAGAAAAR